MDRNTDLFKWMWLVCCFGISNNKLWDFVNSHDSVDTAFDLISNSISRNTLGLAPKELKNAAAVSENAIFEMYDYCEKHDITILCYTDERYPESLRDMYNPPAVLYCRGDLTCFDSELMLSVVGARKASDYSVKVTNALVKQLCRYDTTIVSGFATGIDITAHLSAVRNGGKTIAVLGCGLDYNYPPQNTPFRAEILNNGLFISEYYPKNAGSKFTFPARNRILSALSVGLIVIEASKKSGSLNSVTHAISQGHDVFCVPPHDLFDLRYEGNAGLIRDGAIPLMSASDIFNEYYENYSHKLTHTKTSDYIHKNISPIKEQKNEYVPPVEVLVETKDTTDTDIFDFDISSYNEDEQHIIEIIMKHGNAAADEIALIAEMDISDVLTVLTDLEIDGAVMATGKGYAVVTS